MGNLSPPIYLSSCICIRGLGYFPVDFISTCVPAIPPALLFLGPRGVLINYRTPLDWQVIRGGSKNFRNSYFFFFFLLTLFTSAVSYQLFARSLFAHLNHTAVTYNGRNRKKIAFNFRSILLKVAEIVYKSKYLYLLSSIHILKWRNCPNHFLKNINIFCCSFISDLFYAINFAFLVVAKNNKEYKRGYNKTEQ